MNSSRTNRRSLNCSTIFPHITCWTLWPDQRRRRSSSSTTNRIVHENETAPYARSEIIYNKFFFFKALYGLQRRRLPHNEYMPPYTLYNVVSRKRFAYNRAWLCAMFVKIHDQRGLCEKWNKEKSNPIPRIYLCYKMLTVPSTGTHLSSRGENTVYILTIP